MIVIAGDFGFPDGGAPAARVRNLALGFRSAGVPVHVIAMSDSVGSGRADFRESWGDGLTLERPSKRFTRTNGENRGISDRFAWMANVYRGSWDMARRFRAADLGGERDICILYGRSYARLLPFVRAAREKKMTVLLDVVEGLERFAGYGGAFNPVRWDWAMGARQLPRAVDGVTAISQALLERCRQRGARNVRLVPAIESWSTRTEVATSRLPGPFRLVHVGALSRKDAPDMLVEMIRQLQARGTALEIDLVGRYEHSPEGRRWLDILRNECGAKGMSPMLRFLGAVSTEEIEAIFRRADGFLLLRADTVTERISFPTRLVEYLRQARPVFVSGVGDIPRYLKDGRDAIVLPPGDVVAAAERIDRLVALPAQLREIGIAGWLRGRECFDRETHAAGLLAWAQQLNQGTDHVG